MSRGYSYVLLSQESHGVTYWRFMLIQTGLSRVPKRTERTESYLTFLEIPESLCRRQVGRSETRSFGSVRAASVAS
jgi:hypothetical protein